jgi:hypothetical protein
MVLVEAITITVIIVIYALLLVIPFFAIMGLLGDDLVSLFIYFIWVIFITIYYFMWLSESTYAYLLI